MRRVVVLMLAAYLVVPTMAADEHETLKELSAELQECSVFYRILSESVGRFSETEMVDAERKAEDYRLAHEVTREVAQAFSIQAGMTPEAFDLRGKKLMESEMHIISRRYSNFDNMLLLLERYGVFCRNLVRDPQERREEIRTGKRCSAQYRCWP